MKGSRISQLPTAVLLTALLGIAGPALAASRTSDANFLQEVVRTDSTDTQIGQLAIQKSSSAGVKKLGQMLIDDHATAGPEAARLANTLNVSLPIDQAPDQQATYSALSGLSGAAFDRAFIDAVIQSKQAAIAKFEAQAQSGDGAVAAYAEKTLPGLESQLQMARMLKMRASEHNTP
jgi:putative membrane protein